MPWHSSTHHYITTLLFLAVNQHDALGSSLQHHGARLMGIDKDLPAHIITSLHTATALLTCTVMLHSGHTFLSVPALFGSIGNNSQCTKLTEKTKKTRHRLTKIATLYICTVTLVALYAYSEITARTHVRVHVIRVYTAPLIDGLGHATRSSSLNAFVLAKSPF